eukprot:6771689-Pyramimonas_sp.AAC.1
MSSPLESFLSSAKSQRALTDSARNDLKRSTLDSAFTRRFLCCSRTCNVDATGVNEDARGVNGDARGVNGDAKGVVWSAGQCLHAQVLVLQPHLRGR